MGSNSGWLGGTGESWERGPYFVDGLVPLAYLLGNQTLKTKAQKFIDWTLASQTPDGMFGPKSNDDWWPRMVMLKALTQYQEVTDDPRVIPFLSKYFAYQLNTLPSRPLRDWGKFRWQDNVLTVIWMYNRTHEPSLLDLARLLHKQGYDWQADFAAFKYTQRMAAELIRPHGKDLEEIGLATHGVNNGQAVKAAPVWSMISRQNEDRIAVHQMLSELDRYHGLPNGMFSCDEHFAGRNPSQGTELCTVVETMFSLEQSLAIVGDANLGDRLEQIAFNALPGTLTDDMWAHQYNQQSNQVECSLHHKPWTTDGPESNLFGLEPNFGCCTANFHQGWPKSAASLWMSSEDGGLAAAVYAPCEVHTRIANTDVHLVEETNYPFEETVRIKVNPAAPKIFALQLRIPSWARGTTIYVNGKSQASPSPGTFAKIQRTWRSGDVIELRFPMVPTAVSGFDHSVSVQRGPLVFSYPIGESWVKLRDRGLTSDWQIFPKAQWNYAIDATPESFRNFSVHETTLKANPFSMDGAPVKIEVSARKLVDWRAVDGVADPVPESPVTSAEKDERIMLVPYAAAKLRITAFPRLDDSAE
ncbi:MAG: glycoside hydrolase family 127 protein [Acidobacteriota bacterium]|nr:glycoside hydrolase family 127 protein [Acidobacteriota bacterium]